MTLAWFAEPFQPYGSFAGDGARRVLGKPQLDPLAVLVRETGQNAWDARLNDAAPVRFSVSGWTLSTAQRQLLRADVFARRPPHGLSLTSILETGELSALCISDRGTIGLSGPTRADQPSSGRTDFIDYVFNMGQPNELDGSGGTYGFGKTITYVVSRASTALVHTRTSTPSGMESRLIAIAIGSQYEDDGRRFTGRHWWGSTDGPLVQPVRGLSADILAARLGLPDFAGDETGTDILILAPDFGGRTPRQAMTFLAEASLWHFWPKTISLGRAAASMQFTFAWQGVEIPVPPVAAYPPLNAYAQAFRGVKAFQRRAAVPDDVIVRPVEALRPRRRLGALGIVRVPRLPRHAIDPLAPRPDDGEEQQSPVGFAGNSHHVALMRQVNLVVTYRPGPELPLADVEWAAVFINEPDIDSAFAEAEPPTHDEWNPAMVPDRVQRSFVNVALRNIDSLLRLEFGGGHPPVVSKSERSAVVIADALGGLLAGSHGIGPLREEVEVPDERGRAARARRPTFLGIASRLILFHDEPCTETRFRVRSVDGRATLISADVSVAIDGSRVERDPPLGSPVPSVLGWGTIADVGQGRIAVSEVLTVPSGDDLEWALVVRNPAGAAVSISLTARSVG